ncbi:MAG: HutD/Ves family protein [Eubacteriaceae bacterium]
MKIKIMKPETYQTSEWQGGTTTQLYIYPEDGHYENRDFLIRVSSAKVELENSTFTKLEGIERWLMVLEGQFSLKQGNHKEFMMEPYDITHFMGDLDVKSRGKVRDFNLMLKGVKGHLSQRTLQKNASLKFKKFHSVMVIIYVIKGKGSIGELEVKENEVCIINLSPREVTFISNPENESLVLAISEVEMSD